MTRGEFIEHAKEYGYSDEIIQELISIVEENEIDYEDVALIQQPVY